MRDTSVVEIDLSAVDANMRALRQLVGNEVALCPIMKADAYGLGAARLAKHLVAGGASMLAVYTAEQAAEVIRAASGAPILVLMPIWEIDRTDPIYRYLVEGRLHLSVHGGDHLAAIDRIAWRYGTVIPLHIEIDTGMSRGGSALVEVGPMLRAIAKSRWLKIAGICTQFTSAGADDESAAEQLATFKATLKKHHALIPPGCVIHAANTAATLRDRSFHCGMVRIGIAWMGYGEELLQCPQRAEHDITLRPAVTWSSQIIHVKKIPSGQAVGYGQRWRADRATRLGLVPVGYADGYPPQCAGMDGRAGALVRLCADAPGRAHDVPVVGAVNMDQIAIDLTGIPEAQAGVGARVELISTDADAPNQAPRLAERAGVLTHVILTGINPRVRRVYIARSAAEIETKPAAPRRVATGTAVAV